MSMVFLKIFMGFVTLLMCAGVILITYQITFLWSFDFRETIELSGLSVITLFLSYFIGHFLLGETN